MAADKLVDSSQLDGALKATADEIRRYNNEAETVKKDWDMDTGFAEIVAHITDSDSPATAGTILSGKEAYVNQTKVTGTIESDAGATLYATTSNQTLAVSGKYMTGNVIVSKLTASNFAKENIKYNTTIKVNNGKADVYSVKGTFTQTPSGKTALTAAALRSGYSGFINGQQVDGTMPNSSVSQGNTTVSGTTATRGTATWGTGYITSGSIGAATFANQATSGQTYVDISSTTSAPVLISGDCLYINKGYTDNLKISLAKLVPDLSNAGADISSPSMLNGYTAYNNEGKIITGNIQNLAAADITVNGPTVTIPLEKYTGASDATKITKTIASGEYNADSSASSNSAVTPSLGLDSTASTKYGFTTTKPSGTTGTNFLTVNPNASVTDWSVTPRANITKAGYLDVGNKTGTAVTGSPTVNAGTNYYVPVRTVSFSEGTVTTRNFEKSDLAVALEAKDDDNSNFNISNYTFGNKDTANYPFFIKIGGETDAVAGTTNVSVSARKYTVGAGVIAAVSGGTARSAINQDASVSVNKAYGEGYLSLKSAAIKGTSTNATATTTVAPGTVSVAKSAVATGVTNAADGDATTTAPSSGVYVAVQATAAANSTGTTSSITGSGSATVTTAGYAPTTLTGNVSVSGTATAKTSEKKSSVTYVKIKSGAGEANSANVVRFDTDGSNAGVNIKDVIGTGSTTEPSTGYYAAFTGSGSSKISTAGWMPTGNLAAASKTVYFPVTTAKVTHSGGGLTVNSNYSATPTITMTMDQNTSGFAIQDSLPSSGYYLTIGSETAQMTGTTKVTRAAYTELWEKGYLPDKTQWNVLGSDSKSPTVTVGQATKTRYVTVPSGKITNNTSGGSSTATINRGKQIKIAKGYYNEDLYYTAQANSGTLTISEYGNTTCDGYYTVSVPQGVITNNTSGGTSSGTINRGSQIKIGKGFYNADLYYTAQANSGTLTITTNHDAHTNISCDGKLNVNVQGITVPMNQPFTLVSAADSALDSTSDITVTNGAYRNLVLTNAANGRAEITNNGTISSLTNGGTISEITNESNKVISSIINDGTVTITNSTKATGCGNLTVQAYATSGASSVTSKLITQNGLWVSTTASAATTYYGKVTVPSGTQGKPSGGALTVLASGSGTNCEFGNQDVSGVSFVVTGSATRATVGCSITKAGWLNKTSTTLSATSKSASPVIYFLNGVTLTTPASGERVFKVTVPNGSSTITFTFHVDSSGNVTVTES